MAIHGVPDERLAIDGCVQRSPDSRVSKPRMWKSTGRLPITQGGTGRDHNRHAFTLLLAGGGFKPGHIHGATDEFGYKAVENVATIYDLHATLLHLLGLDHERLTFYHNGTERRLTDVHGKVVQGILA